MGKIYTRTGDRGVTSLPGKSGVFKDSVLLEAIGTADELNAALGLARAEALPEEIDRLLEQFQNDLLALGAELAAADPQELPIRRIGPQHIEAMELAIDRHEATLPPLTGFVLPTGTRAAGALHLARTICRRAERRLVTFDRESGGAISPHLLPFLNRLNDLLFVLARSLNATAGRGDALWRKGEV